MSAERLFAVKEEMEKAEARRLQPYFVRSFFLKAFEALGGSIHPREAGALRDHPRARRRSASATAASPAATAASTQPVLKRYERVCFTNEAVRPLDKPGAALARCSCTPAIRSCWPSATCCWSSTATCCARAPSWWTRPTTATSRSLLFLLTHEVKSGDGAGPLQAAPVRPRRARTASASFAGWAPHLDLEPLAAADRPRLKDLLDAPWIRADQEQRALALAAATLVPGALTRRSPSRRIAHVDKTLAAVHERLTKEIAFWSDRWMKLKDDQAPARTCA